MEPSHRHILICAITVASIAGITYYLLEDDRKVKRRKTSRVAERAALRSLNQIRDDELTVESDIKKLEQNVNDKECDDKAFKQKEYTLAHANEMLLRLMERLDAIGPLTAVMGERNLEPNEYENTLISSVKTRKRQIIESIQGLFRRVDVCSEKIKTQAKEREEIAKEKARLEQKENERKAREAEELERVQKEKERLQQEEAERVAKEEAQRRLQEEEEQLVQEVSQQVESIVTEEIKHELENQLSGSYQTVEVDEAKEEEEEELVAQQVQEIVIEEEPEQFKVEETKVVEEEAPVKENGVTEEKETNPIKVEEPVKQEEADKVEEPVKEEPTKVEKDNAVAVDA
jgi:hypothetical protein